MFSHGIDKAKHQDVLRRGAELWSLAHGVASLAIGGRCDTRSPTRRSATSRTQRPVPGHAA